MSESFLPYLDWKTVVGEAALQATLGIVAVLLACAVLPRLSGIVRSWLWRLAFGRVLLALFWSAPLTLPALPSLRSTPAHPPQPEAEIWIRSPVGPSAPLPQRHPLPDPGMVLGWVWLAGALGCLGHGVRQLGLARGLLHRSRPVTDPELLDCWEALLDTFGIWRSPELREADHLDSPLLLQVALPVVVLPARLTDEWSVEQIRLMLAHELAHLRRRDLAWGWLPAATHALLFFHPLVWIGGREWRLAHDSAADELALRITGAPAAEYARLLVYLAGSRRPAPAGLAMMDARDSARTLERRLKLMNPRRTSPPSGSPRLPVPAFLLGLAIAIPVRVIAQTPAPAPSRAAPASESIHRDTQQRAADAQAVIAQTRGQLAASTIASRTSMPKRAPDNPEKRRLRETEQQVRALKAELDQVVRRNRELKELQRQLDQEVSALRARRGENPPAAADLDREARAKTLSERERELRERDLERSRENVAVAESARLRALEELDQAQRALQEAQARVAGLRAPAPGKPDPSRLNVSVFDYTLRLLRED